MRWEYLMGLLSIAYKNDKNGDTYVDMRSQAKF